MNMWYKTRNIQLCEQEKGVEKKVVQRVSAGGDPLLQPGTTGPSLISSLG